MPWRVHFCSYKVDFILPKCVLVMLASGFFNMVTASSCTLGSPSCAERHSLQGWSCRHGAQGRGGGLGQQPPVPLEPPSSTAPVKLSHQEKVQTRTAHSCTLGLFFTRVLFFFLISVTIMGRRAPQALFHVHSSVWVTFGFWLISAYLVCKGGFF